MKASFIEAVAGMLLFVAACPATAPDVYRSWFTPTVVPNNFTGDVRFEAEITGLSGSVSFNYNGVDRPMRDDGTGGDRLAGDAVWTCLFTASEVLTRNTANRVHRPVLGTCRFSPTATLNVIAEVWSPPIGLVTPTRSGGEFQETDYVINYVATRAQLTTFNAAFWANRFYQTHGDKYDFLSFVHIAGVRGNRYHSSVRNSVQGIGTAIFNNSAGFGSAGRLQGISVFPIPSFYDGGGPGFAHETGHQWINFLSGTPLAGGVPHWPKGNVAINVMGFSLPGGVGGQFPYTFASNGSGGYVVGTGIPANLTTFNPMELYLMGLAAPAEVPAYFVLNNQNQNITSGQTLTATEITPVTVNDVIAAKGPRAPNSVDSQKLFRCATIILSEQLLDAYALSLYDFFTRRAEARQPLSYAEGLASGVSNPFYVATGGRAVMITKIADERPLLVITRLEDGKFRLNFGARMGVSYQAQRSLDLQAWANEGGVIKTPVVNPPVDPMRELMVEPTPGTTQTFYRLQALY